MPPRERSTYKPPLVVTLHGIRTRGEWQKSLADTLSVRGIPTHSYDYGNYSLLRFMIPALNDRMIESFYRSYQAACRDVENKVDLANYRKRPSVIAHSFGSYIVGYCMLKYEEVKFDKVIFCGSVLPEDFDWTTLLQRDQVFRIRNEFGMKDTPTKVVGTFVRRTGGAGARGFDLHSANFEQQPFDHFHHSDFFAEGHIRDHWLPFLTREPSPLHVRHGRDITDPKEFGAMLDVSRNTLDREAYGTLQGMDEVALPPDRSRTWIDIEPDIYTFLVERGKNPGVKGYLNAMPIEDGTLTRLLQGRIDDNQITADDVASYTSRGVVNIYLMSVVIAEDARKHAGLMNHALEKLLCGIVDKLVYYKRHHGVRVSQVVGVGWTPQGRKLCSLIGLQERGKDRFGNPIFWADLQDPALLQPKHRFHPLRRLAAVYQS